MPRPSVFFPWREGESGGCLLLVPPFARLDFPNLAVHILQAQAAARGIPVRVIYAGLSLAAEIGIVRYHAISEAVTPWRLGERLFSAPAFDLPLLGRHAAQLEPLTLRLELGETGEQVSLGAAELRTMALQIQDWVPRFCQALAALEPEVVGVTTVFEQLSSAYALLRHLKALQPEVHTVVGGANCSDGLADGVASLGPAIDTVCSGECEALFPELLLTLRAGQQPASRILRAGLRHDLDSLSDPDYADYFQAIRHFEAFTAPQKDQGESPVPSLRSGLLPIESSRGCWWGQKHPCTFCSVNPMQARQKSPGRVLEGLRRLLAQVPEGWLETSESDSGPRVATGRQPRVQFVDDLLPHAYFWTLLPQLQTALPGMQLFCNQKPNLKLEQVLTLKQAGVVVFQAGIEALSGPLLRRMDKGVTVRQNVALLRYAQAVGIRLVWNLLYGVPGDSAQDYEETRRLLPQIHHLPPPQGWHRVQLLRFSLYGQMPEKYGISRLRAASAYADLFPEQAQVEALATFLDGEYACVADSAPDLVTALGEEVSAWRRAWADSSRPPVLEVSGLGPGLFVLHDTRGLPGCTPWVPLSVAQAICVLIGCPIGKAGPLEPIYQQAVAFHCVVPLEGWYVPLATANPELIQALEREAPAWFDPQPLSAAGSGEEEHV